jgi:hypothetical protein
VAHLSSAGIDIDLPRGWEGRIYRRSPDPAVAQARAAGVGGGAPGRPPTDEQGAVAHVANFALPQGMGDFGSGGVEIMRSPDLLVCLFEYEGSAGQPLFERWGVPRSLRASDFDENIMRTPLPGMSAAQLFFTEADRAFCLYVVVGSHLRRFRTLPLINQVLATIRIS